MSGFRGFLGFSVLGVLALLGSPATTAAQTTIAWGAVHGQPGSATVIPLACQQADQTHRLYATIIPSEALSDFIEMDAIVDFGYFAPPHQTAPPLAPFWHFESGGCNELGLSFDPRGGAATGLPTPWTSLRQWSATYAPDFGGPGRGRLQITIARSTPMSLQAGTEYFAFTIDLSTCMAAICDGCSDDVGIYFAQAALLGATSYYVATGNSLSMACANTCVSYSSLVEPAMAVSEAAFRPVSNLDGPPCLATPATSTTWGQLKVVYR